VNGNQISGVMMGGIGEAAYFIDGPNSENTISSGFVAGFGECLCLCAASLHFLFGWLVHGWFV
jgi:hypothetical protein